MRKKLAIFIAEIAGDFQQIILKTITGHANALGYDVVTFCSYGSYNDDILYAEGEKASIHLPDCSVFDGIIVTEDLFDIHGMDDELYAILINTAKCPVVYLRSTREGFYSILVENTGSVKKMTRHFIDEHHFTDICYMSGKKGYLDTEERLKGYVEAMQESNLPVTEHMIFHGDYWRDKGEEAVNWFMEGRTTYPQAIVCANDYMAISVCDELRKRGVRVPEDVCVSGFDFVDAAKIYEPTLTSLQVDFEEMSTRAVDIIDNVNSGKGEEMIQRVPANLLLNKSCGCGEQFSIEDVAGMIESNYKQVASMKNVMLSTMEYQDSLEFDEYMFVAEKYRSCLCTDRAFFCFNNNQEQGFDAVENDSAYTSQMVLRRTLEGMEPAKDVSIVFDRGELLPKEYWKEDEPNNYLFFTMHFKNIVFGYIVVELPTKSWFDIYTQAYIMTLSNAIQTSDIHRRMVQLEEIKSLYQKDALTGLYNRRGYDKLLRDRFAKARESGEPLGLVSLDMDNLKFINDNYGHAEGDRALKAIADCLAKAMEDGEFCARVGGDEFAAAINLNIQGRAERFRKVFHKELSAVKTDMENYGLDASIGVCDINEDCGANLISCIKTADMRMYEEKRSRKEVR